MEKLIGNIQTWFENKYFGFIRNPHDGTEVFFYLGDVQGDPRKIVVGARVEYAITAYKSKGKDRTKAVNVVILPAPTFNAPSQSVGEVLATPGPPQPQVPQSDLTVLAVDTKAQGKLSFDAKEDFEWK